MGHKHFPRFTHGIIVGDQSECPASRQVGSYVRSVSTAYSSTIGFMDTRGARHSYVDRVLLAIDGYKPFMSSYNF